MIKHKSYSFLKNLNISKEAESRLSSNLSRIVTGDDSVVVSPYGSDPSDVLKGWDKIFESKQSVVNDVLLEMELSNRSKFGPRSIAVPWEDRKSGVLSYFESGSDKTPKAEGKRLNLRPITIGNAMKFIKNNTNSGLPFLRKKGTLKEQYIQRYPEYLDREDPCVMFTRTQEGNKTRTVWGYPFADVLREMTYYRPLLDYQRKLEWRSALQNPEAVDVRMTYLINKALALGFKLVSIDFSAYDASVKTALQRAAFRYIKDKFQRYYHPEIDLIFKRFNTIRLITPDGILSGSHGVPSGSTFTNEVDSIAQYLIAKENGENYFDIQGDDGAYATADPTKLIDSFNSYGLQVNESKTYIADNYLVYLQNLYHTDYKENGLIRGIYPTYRALNRIVYLERFVELDDLDISGKDYFSIRTISILENCKYHPLFKDLVRYVYNLDKYKLKFTQHSIIKYIKGLNDATGVEGIFKYRRGLDLSGINEFETVKYLKVLSGADS